MLVNLFKTKSPVAIFAFPVLVAILALPVFWEKTVVDGAVYSWQSEFTAWLQSNSWLYYCATIGVVYLSGLELNRVVNNYGFYSKNTYLPGIIYVLALFGFGQFTFSFPVIGYGCLIAGLGYLFRINRQDPAQASVFFASFFFGIATVCDPLLLPIVVLPWFSLLIFRSFIWREWFMLFLGAGLPWLYHYAIYFICTGSFLIETEGLALVNESLSFSWVKVALVGYTILLIAYAFWRFLIVMNNQLLVFKKRSYILFNAIWLVIISFGLGWWLFDRLVLAIAVPLAIIAAVQMLYNKRELAANLMLIAWLALMVLNKLL